MRLLQLNLRSLLLYALLLVVVSIPVSLLSIREILKEEVDESLKLHRDQFVTHIKRFEYLDDLETDLHVLDQLTYDINIKPFDRPTPSESYQTVTLYDSMEHEDRPFRELSSSVLIQGKPYLLSIKMSLVDNDELLFAIGSVQIVVVIVLALGLILINRSLSQKLWKPFYKTLHQLKTYEIDKNETLEAETTNILEFDDLNKAVSSLTDRNRKVFLQQKEFIENASHELQTPLAIFQSKLDVLMQSPTLSEGEAATILELESTAQRMARLNKNLLLLTKIDNEQFSTKELVDIPQVLEGILSNLKPLADLQDICVETSLEQLIVQANRTLIEVLLTNLVQNAIRHTKAKGKVSLQLTGQTFRIANTGTPLKMDHRKMFERFSKESGSPASSGLGLAIAKQICDSNAYELTYAYKTGEHVFSVKFT